jgi:hypothetical protein
MTAFVGIQPVAPVGISEIRSTLGSFFLGLGDYLFMVAVC